MNTMTDNFSKNSTDTSAISMSPVKPEKKKNKYLYGWKLYVNYGQRWEYELFEEIYAGYKENWKAYRDNCDYPTRWSRGRILND